MCVATVLELIPSRAAISVWVRPSARSPRTSSSRGVRVVDRSCGTSAVEPAAEATVALAETLTGPAEPVLDTVATTAEAVTTSTSAAAETLTSAAEPVLDSAPSSSSSRSAAPDA